MTRQQAVIINSAACRVWLFKEGLSARLPCEDVRTVREATAAQIETSAEIVEAINRDAPAEGGRKIVQCTLDSAAIPAVKSYVETWEK